jgi:hypothetical protein
MGAAWNFCVPHYLLSIPKTLSGANALEIIDIQEERNRKPVLPGDPEYNDVTLFYKMFTA